MNLLLMIVPLAVLSFFFYVRFLDTMKDNMIESLDALTTEMTGSVDLTMGRVNETLTVVVNHPMLYILDEVDEQMLTENPELLEDAIGFLGLVELQSNTELISDIKIYTEKSMLFNQYDAIRESDVIEPVSKIKRSYWYGIFQTIDEDFLSVPSFYMNQYELENNGRLSMVKRIQTSKGDEIYVVVYFSNVYIEAILNQYATFENSTYYILNERDTAISINSKKSLGEYLVTYKSILENDVSSNGFDRVIIDDQILYVTYREINLTDWQLICYIPENQIILGNKILAIQFILLYMAISGIVLLLTTRLGKSIVQRIGVLNQVMKSVKEEEPQMIDHSDQRDEIGELIDSYNYMVQRLERITAEKVNAVTRLNQVELNVLQEQINPHFLYNTLDMINWYASNDQTEEIREVIYSLSKFYRLSFLLRRKWHLRAGICMSV